MDSGDEPRFLMDQMLVTVGKYLRVAGHDAEWDLRATRRELIVRANAGGRVFVTCNRRALDEVPRPAAGCTLAVGDPVAQFREIVRLFGLDAEAGLFTKCIRCNVPLDTVADHETVRGRVHPNVFARHRRFYACPRCGTVFWRGSHVANACRKLNLPPPEGTQA